MKTFRPYIIIAAVAGILQNTSCSDFLETRPHGVTTFDNLSSDRISADRLLIGAYANLDGQSLQENTGAPWTSAGSNWIYGGILGGDAHKGSAEDDGVSISDLEKHTITAGADQFLDLKWATYYNGIARANDAIRAFTILEAAGEKNLNSSIAEARFLRGFYHYELRKIFGKVPYIDEEDQVTDVRVGNEGEAFYRIEADFQFAAANLPQRQTQVGRVTWGAAVTYFGIIKMWRGKYDSAKLLFDQVINSGRYKLNARYHENFSPEFRNSDESILEVQQAIGVGTGGLTGNPGDQMHYPLVGIHCCGFYQPSQDLVNSFRTDASGLPFLDNYNDVDVTSDEGIPANGTFTPYGGTLDPRLDWTVGRRGIPFLDWGPHPGIAWIRSQPHGGPYSPRKYLLHKSQEAAYMDQSSWSHGESANNFRLMRYADLLLLTAEAEVELGNLARAMDLVNQVRNRAANPAGFLRNQSSTGPAANYLISPYSSFPNSTYARKAVQFERRLELGMEGHRFFDLVRWKIAAEVKNAYFKTEAKKRTYLATATFIKGTHEYMPIPLRAIEYSYKDGKPTLKQNPGY